MTDTKPLPYRAIDSLPYRACVGVMLVNQDGLVFVGERIDTPGAWQMPQGGVDAGEDELTAAYRELEEEIGVAQHQVSLINQTRDWLTYDLPEKLVNEGKVWRGKYRGQKQLWFLMQLKAADSAINIEVSHPEFGRWKWAEPESLPQMIVPFKRDIYQTLVDQFSPDIKAL